MSYYTKGSLVALALDLTLRREGARQRSTTVMRLALAAPALAGRSIEATHRRLRCEAVGGRGRYTRELAEPGCTARGELPLARPARAGVRHRLATTENGKAFTAALGLRLH